MSELQDLKYPVLMNAGRSAREIYGADVDTNKVKKDELVDNMQQEGITYDDGDFYLKGEEMLTLQSNPNTTTYEPKKIDRTMLYCEVREATTEEFLDELEEVLVEHTDYNLGETSRDDTLTIQLPVENQGDDDGDEPETDEDQSQESESDSQEPSDDSETSEESTEESTGDSESDAEDTIGREIAKERFEENKTKEDVMDLAKKHGVSGRGSMNKEELIDSVLDAMPQVE